jgi:RNA polymerase primary sigma factor
MGAVPAAAGDEPPASAAAQKADSRTTKQRSSISRRPTTTAAVTTAFVASSDEGADAGSGTALYAASVEVWHESAPGSASAAAPPAEPARGAASPTAAGVQGRCSDDLQSYINRLTRCNLLTADEEVRLARRVAAGDLAAKARLVESNMRLVVSMAKAYRASGIPFEDLIQEGAIGLMTAAERFDPGRGYRFSTYATQWIRQAIGRAVDNKAKSIRLPAHVSESLRKLDKARAEMRREFGEEPTPDQLSQRTGISPRKVRSLLNTTQDPISLDMPVGDEENTSLGALLHDQTSPDPQKELIDAEMREAVEWMMNILDEREQVIMRKRFGFDGDETYVLQQIGEELNISRERVRQIEAQALRKLRLAARKRRLRDYL